MLIVIFLLLSLVASIDYVLYRRMFKNSEIKLWGQILFKSVITISYLLAITAFALYISPFDNSTLVVKIVMWSFFMSAVMITLRFIYYIFGWFRWHKTGTLVTFALAMLLLWGVTYGRTSYIVNRVDIFSNKLPESFDGFEIVHISDIHIGTMIDTKVELSRLVDRINKLNADIVVFSGDLINIRYSELDSEVMQILGNIEAPYGVVSNIGNHDTGQYMKDTLTCSPAENLKRLIERQNKMGWRVLDNQSELLYRNGDSISISAVSFSSSLHKQRHEQFIKHPDLKHAYNQLDSSLFNITVSHVPQMWDDIVALGYGDLTLAGHVHGGQMKFSIGELSLSPVQFLYERWSGRYDKDGSTLYINDGIGYVGIPMRLGAYPEITLLKLKK